MKKKGNIQIDGTMIIIFIVIGIIVLFFVGSVFGQVGDWFDGIVNDPNRPTKHYDVTCEGRLRNPPLREVSFDESYGVTCYWSKAKFTFSLIPWWSDEGTIKMKAQGKVLYEKFDVEEGGYQEFKMTLKRLNEGETDIELTLQDEKGGPLSSKKIVTIYVGEEL